MKLGILEHFESNIEHLQLHNLKKKTVGGWVDVDGWVYVLKAILRIAYSDQKL